MVPSSLYILTLMSWGKWVHVILALYKHIYLYLHIYTMIYTHILYTYIYRGLKIYFCILHTPHIYIHIYIYTYIYQKKIKQNELWANNLLACITHMVRSAISMNISVLCKLSFVKYFHHGCVAISKFNRIKFFIYLLCSSKKE